MPDVLEKCQAIMEFAPKQMIDSFAEKQLDLRLRKYEISVGKKLADFSLKIDGTSYSSFLDAIHDVKEWDEIEIHFFHPNRDEIWEYDTPTRLIKINRQGRGALMLFEVDHFSLNQWNPSKESIIEPAMFSSYLAHFYSPESIKAHTKKIDEKPLIPPRWLGTPFELWEDIRRKGIVPFQMALCAYSKKRRYLYQLDVINNSLLMDFRNGKIPIANRVFRNTFDYYYLDHFLSMQELPTLAKKVLQVIFELEDANVADIEIGLGITEKMAKNNISALAKRGLIDALGKSPKAKYVINLGRIRELSGGSG
jgi:hypothetical protein